MKSKKTPFRIPVSLAVSALLLIILILVIRMAGDHLPTPAPGSVARAVAPQAAIPANASRSEKVLLRPLPVAQTTVSHEWTEGDISDPAVIERIAHNPDEFVRLVEENARIKRRQLVYRKDTAAAVVQRARAAGEAVRHLTLPGLDGKEIEVEVTRADLAFSGLSGTFTGQVAGMPQSLVTLAFDKGREAFTVVSPEDGNFLQGHPREPGEVLVASFDPATYQPMQACNPILTNP